MKKRKGVNFDITVGELSERSLFTDEFYDRLVTFIEAYPHSLGRLFEFGAAAMMAKFSGDPLAVDMFMDDTRPKPPPDNSRRGKAKKKDARRRK